MDYSDIIVRHFHAAHKSALADRAFNPDPLDSSRTLPSRPVESGFISRVLGLFLKYSFCRSWAEACGSRALLRAFPQGPGSGSGVMKGFHFNYPPFFSKESSFVWFSIAF